MVDIDTPRIINVLESREIDDVAKWLKTYPNLDTVSRDGSVSYNSAIKKANAGIVQVSHRFHLVKGLMDAAKKHITRIVAKGREPLNKVELLEGAGDMPNKWQILIYLGQQTILNETVARQSRYYPCLFWTFISPSGYWPSLPPFSTSRAMYLP